MSATKKPKRRSGPSGPNLARSERPRPKREISMAPESWAELERQARAEGLPVSRRVEQLVMAAAKR